jgi:hypothetical protein
LVDAPERAEAPAQFSHELGEYGGKGFVDRFGFGEGAADCVLNKQPPVQIVALMDGRRSRD